MTARRKEVTISDVPNGKVSELDFGNVCVLAAQKVHVYGLYSLGGSFFTKNFQLHFSRNLLEKEPFKSIHAAAGERKSSRLAAEGFNWLVYHGRAPEV